MIIKIKNTVYDYNIIYNKITTYTDVSSILIQNVSIKLVYLQYLLLYDINLTNGIFIHQ